MAATGDECGIPDAAISNQFGITSSRTNRFVWPAAGV
jgi:hypothetical protein